MSKFRPSTDRDAALCRQVGLVFVWLTAALGIFLLWNTITSPVHILMAIMLIALPLLGRSDKRAVQITDRVLCGIMWALTVLLLIETISTAAIGWQDSFTDLAVGMCVFGGNLLCAWTPGVYILATHGNRYDKVLACFCQTLLAGVTAIGAFTSAKETVVWAWDHPYMRYSFFALATAAAILVWVASFTSSRRTQEKA